MNKLENFYYEHIGHMQFSVLTLETFNAINILSKGKVDALVDFNDAKDLIIKAGFSAKQAIGELDRFCYGYECYELIDLSNKHKIAFTKLGKDFLSSLIKESESQSSMLAFLMRPARRKNNWNVTIQESTFFNENIYKLIGEYKFRQGGARDFIRTISLAEFLDFLEKALKELKPVDTDANPSLKSCIEKVKKQGKYWASVGSKYSWFVYSQNFHLSFQPNEWLCYDKLINSLIRPTEWGGGGHDASFKEILDILQTEEILKKFLKSGIIRPIWKDSKIENALFRITSPGFLMWERKKKGFIYEFQIKKNCSDSYELALCDSTDFPKNANNFFSNGSTSEFISKSTMLNSKYVKKVIVSLLDNEKNLFNNV